MFIRRDKGFSSGTNDGETELALHFFLFSRVPSKCDGGKKIGSNSIRATRTAYLVRYSSASEARNDATSSPLDEKTREERERRLDAQRERARGKERRVVGSHGIAEREREREREMLKYLRVAAADRP